MRGPLRLSACKIRVFPRASKFTLECAMTICHAKCNVPSHAGPNGLSDLQSARLGFQADESCNGMTQLGFLFSAGGAL